jgi:RNA polymerase-interacting CarD/CdnL/TRCF family regulator
MIALSRQHVQEQSTMITALEAGLKKAGAGADLDKARAHLAAEKEARMRMAAELARASEVKNDAKEVYEKMKSSQIPEFAKLTKSLGQVKKGKELADSIGKEAGELVNSIMDWVQHLK